MIVSLFGPSRSGYGDRVEPRKLAMQEAGQISPRNRIVVSSFFLFLVREKILVRVKSRRTFYDANDEHMEVCTPSATCCRCSGFGKGCKG